MGGGGGGCNPLQPSTIFCRPTKPSTTYGIQSSATLMLNNPSQLPAPTQLCMTPYIPRHNRVEYSAIFSNPLQFAKIRPVHEEGEVPRPKYLAVMLYFCRNGCNRRLLPPNRFPNRGQQVLKGCAAPAAPSTASIRF